jgi:hypothetical protein
MAENRTSQPLARLAEILLEQGARVRLNEIRDLLEALDHAAYADGFRDGQQSADDTANEAAERQDDLSFGSRDPSDGCGA